MGLAHVYSHFHSNIKAILLDFRSANFVITSKTSIFLSLYPCQRRRSDLKSGGTEKFRLAPSALAKFFAYLLVYMGTRRKISRGAQNYSHLKKIDHFFVARKTQTTICAFFTTFKTKLKGVYCKRRRREQKFKGVFKTAEYDVIF